MTAIAPPALVVGAVRAPLPYGLFSTFTLRTGVERWESGIEFETGTCDPVDGIGQLDCADPPTAVGLPKDLASNNGTLGTATPFTVYGHFQCSPVGYTFQSAQDKASQHLLAREEARVEQALWTGDLGNTPELASGSTNLSVAGVSPHIAVKLLEDFMAEDYGSVGVIHMTRGMAAVLGGLGLLVASGGRLTTITGTPVAAGAGYPGTGPSGEAHAEDTGWAYVSPALFGYRSEIFTSSARPGDLFDRTQNDLYAVAERNYLLGFDPCGVGAVLIDLT